MYVWLFYSHAVGSRSFTWQLLPHRRGSFIKTPTVVGTSCRTRRLYDRALDFVVFNFLCYAGFWLPSFFFFSGDPFVIRVGRIWRREAHLTIPRDHGLFWVLSGNGATSSHNFVNSVKFLYCILFLFQITTGNKLLWLRNQFGFDFDWKSSVLFSSLLY